MTVREPAYIEAGATVCGACRTTLKPTEARSRWPLILLGLLLVAGVAGGIGWHLLQQREPAVLYKGMDDDAWIAKLRDLDRETRAIAVIDLLNEPSMVNRRRIRAELGEVFDQQKVSDLVLLQLGSRVAETPARRARWISTWQRSVANQPDQNMLIVLESALEQMTSAEIAQCAAAIPKQKPELADSFMWKYFVDAVAAAGKKPR